MQRPGATIRVGRDLKLRYHAKYWVKGVDLSLRNKGMEFITHSLLPIGQAVAARHPAEISNGLLGHTRRDEPGKGRADSRTGTGLAPLGPVDAARAWAGLWALAAVPVWAKAHGKSVSSAALPGRGAVRGRLLMPQPASWITAPRMMAALRSRHLVTSASAARGGIEQAEVLAAHRALGTWGFARILAFPVNVSGSASAPERRALGAEVVA